MSDFRFANPYVWLLLIPTVFLLWFWWRNRNWTNAPVLRYSDTSLLSSLDASTRLRLRQIPNLLRLIAWFCLLTTLARPQIGNASVQVQGQGIDIVLALDISDSMATNDFSPNRLEAAKAVIADFISNRISDRIGLVVFAEQAFYQAPPTVDYNVLLGLVESAPFAHDLGLGDRTAIGLGIATATNMLRNSDSTSKVIILLTDGENNAGQIDPITAAEAARAVGVRIYTIGIGVNSGTSGNMDFASLQRIASIGNGRHYLALDTEDLFNIYDEINNLETINVNSQFNIRWQDMTQSFVIAALLALFIERVLRHSIFQTIP